MFKIEKGLRAWQLIDLDHFMTEVIKKDKLKGFDDRVDILLYNMAELIKSKIYKKHYGKYEVDLLVKLSDILMITLALIKIAKLDIADVVNLGIQRYHQRVWEEK